MIAVECANCGCELDQPGGILLGPPDADDKVHKQHLCVACYMWLRTMLG